MLFRLLHFVSELGSDAMIKHVDTNPFVPVAVMKTLVPVLAGIESSMV